MNDEAARLDIIRITDIVAHGKHGVTEVEREQNLPLELNVELLIDLSKASASDDIEDTVNYSTLHSKIVKVVETRSRNLLEKLAQDVLECIFEDKRVREATVQISKVKRLAGATPSVTLTRRNPA